MKKMLTKWEAMQRRAIGLPLDDEEFTFELEPASREPEKLQGDDADNVLTRWQARQRSMIGLPNGDFRIVDERPNNEPRKIEEKSSCSSPEACSCRSCSFQTDAAKSLRAAALRHRSFNNREDNDVDVLAVCEDNSFFLIDHGLNSYFKMNFESVNGQPEIIGFELITPPAMVQKYGGLLRECVQASEDVADASRIRRITEHLTKYKQLLLG